jgi:hypothetical protein
MFSIGNKRSLYKSTLKPCQEKFGYFWSPFIIDTQGWIHYAERLKSRLVNQDGSTFKDLFNLFDWSYWLNWFASTEPMERI